MSKDLWKITIQLRNEQHEVLETVLVEREFAYTDRINQHLEPLFKSRLFDLDWRGFGLWAEHIPIKAETTFAHINFLRQADKSIVLQCENHNCQWRAITIPKVKTEECIVCMDAQPDPKRFAMCGHNVMCNDCRASVRECPMCRYPFS